MQIQNEFQLENTRKWAARFAEDIRLARLGPVPENVHPEIHAAGIRAMEAKLDDLHKEIEEWLDKHPQPQP